MRRGTPPSSPSLSAGHAGNSTDGRRSADGAPLGSSCRRSCPGAGGAGLRSPGTTPLLGRVRQLFLVLARRQLAAGLLAAPPVVSPEERFGLGSFLAVVEESDDELDAESADPASDVLAAGAAPEVP